MRVFTFQVLLGIDPVQDCAESAQRNGLAHLPTGYKNSDKIDVNAVNAAGETCLYLAAAQASVPLVEALLRAGANPRVGTTDKLALHLAVEKESQELVFLGKLLSNIASPTVITLRIFPLL